MVFSIYMKNKILLLALSLLFSSLLRAQTVINKYAAVSGFRFCDNALTVDTATGFNIGDTVLIIQMKGATADSSNTPAFGDVLNYNNAGNYEYNVIEAKNGNDLVLRYTIIRNYDIPDGKVQLVRIPSYLDYTISQPHTCMPWNGSKGGVFALHVKHTLSLNQAIDVSGKGFRGATNNLNPAQTGPLICSNINYYMAPNFDSGSMKGEGITVVSTARSFGRGKLGNGGGGGNTFNAGGGGGGNGGNGGTGGAEYRGCNSMPSNNKTGGIGGATLIYSATANKIFMGGGGGSAQANNFTISTGGNGGGICIITAGKINTSQGLIRANGGNALECTPTSAYGSCHDGMGGGGGAGTVLINTDSVVTLLPVLLTGGKGGDMSGSGANLEVGPGGGGGGGVVWLKPATLSANLLINTNGGSNGTNLYNGSAWGAQPGQNGQLLTQLQLSSPTDTFANRQIIAGFSDSVINCFNRRLLDERAAYSVNTASWLWRFPGQDTATQQFPAFTFPGYGSYPVTLTVTGFNGCVDSVTHNVHIAYRHFAQAGSDTGICTGASAQLRAGGGVSYAWSPAAATDTATIPTPIVAPAATATYTVAVTDSIGCVDQDSVTVHILPLPDIGITTATAPTVTCINRQIQLSGHGAVTYAWSPGGLCNDSTIATPIVTAAATTRFMVTGTDINGCINTDSIIITSLPGETRVIMPNAFSPDNNGLNDEIKPVGVCDFDLEQFVVYNRLGQRIFSTRQAGKGWDGSYGGNKADIGTYYYIITGKNEHRETLTLRGSFILLR